MLICVFGSCKFSLALLCNTLRYGALHIYYFAKVEKMAYFNAFILHIAYVPTYNSASN